MYKGQYHKIQEGVNSMIEKFWSMVIKTNQDNVQNGITNGREETYKFNFCSGREFDNKEDFNNHIDKEIARLQAMKL